MRRVIFFALLTLFIAPSQGCGWGVDYEPAAKFSLSDPLPAGDLTYVSKLGCAKQDVDLNTGKRADGHAATDDTDCINAALAKATADHPVTLIQDGASLTHGIHGPAAGHWSIVGRGGGYRTDGVLFGSGFYQAAGANDDVIYNGTEHAGCPHGYTDPIAYKPGLPPTRGSDVILRDFAINGNRGDGKTGNSNRGAPNGYGSCWLMGINLMDLDNIEVRGVTFYNTSTFNLRLSDVGTASVHHSLFANTGLYPKEYLAQNGDGIHVSGPGNDINLSENTFITTDDAIALNAPEGWGGLITNVTITDSFVRQAGSMLRVYTASAPVAPGNATPAVENVSVDNLSGTAPLCGFIGLGDPHDMTRLSTIKNYKWSNSTCDAPLGFYLSENAGDITFENFTWKTSDKHLGFINATAGVSHLDELNFKNFTLKRESNNVTGLVDSLNKEGKNSVVIGKILIDGLSLTDLRPLSPLKHLLSLADPSPIRNITLKSVDPAKVLSVSNEPTQIQQIQQLSNPAIPIQ